MSCVYVDWMLVESTAFMLTGQQPVNINAWNIPIAVYTV